MKNKNLNWLKSYLSGNLKRSLSKKTIGKKHLMFLFVDHFEIAGKEPRLSEWLEKYPKIADKYTDSDGYHPKHTWFYAMDLMIEDELKALKILVDKNYGEIELHWHHSHDTSESFWDKITNGLKIFQKYGFMKPIKSGYPGCFGFIHGNWSLDNSGGDHFCGVNNEIELLKKAGCYGDFTFPALFSKCQPDIINSIYYAIDDEKPKSYNKGRVACVGKKEIDNEFMIFEGPLTINWRDWRFKWHPTLEDGDIGKSCTHYDPKRIDAWVRQNIHVDECPNWIFVKVFCHGGQDYEYVLSDYTELMFKYLDQKYNDGVEYCLHYVTAREAYNIVKAAEDGKNGNPNDYRDYIIPHPLNR